MQLVQIPNWLAKLPVIKNYRLGLPTAAAAKKKEGEKLIQIISEFEDRSRKNIKSWRDAIELCQHPDTPKWYMIQDLFNYLLMDSHAHSQVELRVAATMSSRFYVYDRITGEEQPEKTNMLINHWFYNYMRELLFGRAHGYTIMFLEDPINWKLKSLPRRNIIPQLSTILPKVGEDFGINYKEPIFENRIIEMIDDYQFGYLNDIAPQIIWKMNAQQSWAEFSEKFAMPGIIAITDKSDDKSLNKLQDLLKTLGESLTAALPRGTEITPLQMNPTANGHLVYDAQIQRCNSEISKRILGGTMLSDQGSSRSQSEVHERNLDQKIAEADKRMVEFITTDQMFPMLMRFKPELKITENDAFAFDRSQQLTLKEHWDIVAEVLKSYDVEDEWIKKTFQVPITGKKETAPVPADGNFNKASKSMAAALEAKAITLPVYKGNCCKVHVHPTAESFTDGILEELSDILLNELWVGKDTLTTEVLKSIAGHRKLLDGLFEGWGSRQQLTYDATDHHCLAMMEYNLFEFSRLKERANAIYLNQLLIDKDTNNIRTFNDFRDKALPYLNNADVNWLRTEYNHAVAVGQGASRYHQFMSEADTVTSYGVIQTMGDARVRLKHQSLEGKIVKFTEKGGMTIWVPFDIGCRCEILQYLGDPDADKIISSSGIYELIDKKPGDKWTGNRGTLEKVFTANELYLKQNQLTDESGSITFKQYQLPAISEMENLVKLVLDKTITKKNAADLFKPEDGKDYMGLTDYLDRKMVVTKRTFDKHTSGHYVNDKEQRHRLFPHVKDVLSDPDEVYFVKYQRKDGKAYYQTNYIKFFDGESLVVNTKAGSEHLEINTWYINDLAEDEMRQGYLIHKKKKP